MATRDAIKSSLKQLNNGCVSQLVSRLMIIMIMMIKIIMMLAVALVMVMVMAMVMIWQQPNSQFCFSSIDKALKSNYDDKSVNIRQSF